MVGPLSHSYAAAGFFPKSNETLIKSDSLLLDEAKSSSTSDSEEYESVYNQSKYWLIDSSKDHKKLNKQFLRCIQTSNLRNNFLYWDAKSNEKQAISVAQSIEEKES